MNIENLTNPGEQPVHGDVVRITHASGAIEEKQFIDLPYEAPSPPVARIDTPLFIMRFTPQERVAMRQAAKADNEYASLIEDWLAILNDPRLAYVELGDPNLVAAMGMMVSLGLLTQERADIVMAP